MVINIALGMVLGVVFLAIIAVAGYMLVITLTKHTKLTQEYTDVHEWFKKDNVADKIEKVRGH